MYYYDCRTDRVLEIKKREELNQFHLGDGIAGSFWELADEEAIILSESTAEAYVRKTVYQIKKVRRKYLNQQIDKLRRLKVSDPEIIEF